MIDNACNICVDHPFLKTTISNWLTSVNEKGYQLPFCQLLLSQGYTVVHSSTHNAFEQGKDIIAMDRNGEVSAFQLKGGKITLSKWRNEVKQEIEELIDLTCVHPSLGDAEKHKSFLVTNGEIVDTVRLQIENLNRGKWKENPLNVLTYGDLLLGFTDISSDFIPSDVAEYRQFLNLYLTEGSEFIDAEECCKFISNVLRLESTELSNNERRRNIAAAVLFTSYICGSFRKINNHVAIIHILSLLLVNILAIVERYNLADKYWYDSFSLVFEEVILNSLLLQKEVVDNRFEDITYSIWDGELGKYRRHLAVSYLIAFKLSQFMIDDPGWCDIADAELLLDLHNNIYLAGEASVFTNILFCIYINKLKIDYPVDKFEVLYAGLVAIIESNGRKGNNSLETPYYSIDEIIRRKFELTNESGAEKFTGKSFLLRPCIDILVRHNQRNELEKFWREISYIMCVSFVPAEHYQYLQWHCDKGKETEKFPNAPQIWQELISESNEIDTSEIPNVLSEHPYLLPFYLLVYPHRISSNFVKLIDQEVSGSESQLVVKGITE